MDIFLRIKDSKFANVVALYIIATLVAWMAGLPFMMNGANAAMTAISDTVTDSDLSVAANHTISFDTSVGVAEGETITLTFQAGFDLTGVIEDDVDIASSTVDLTTAATCGAAEQASVEFAGQVVTITICAGDGGAISPGATVEIEIGSNATASGTGVNQIDNPGTAGAKTVDIGGTMTDAGQALVVIIDDISVTAAVNATFQFTIAGLNTGEAVNGTSTSGTSTATSLPFGTLVAGNQYTLGQRLTVTTNAAGGFIVTVFQDRNLESSTGSDIDQFVDSHAAGTSTPKAWQAPAGTSGVENTYGHFGFTSEDSDLNGNEFGTDLWAGDLGSARQVFSHTGVADGTTPDIGVTDVAYQVEISAFQEAGSDYSNTLTYVATPTF